jgi:sensor domain CHASE-containing protein
MFKMLSKIGVGRKIFFLVLMGLGIAFVIQIIISQTVILNGFLVVEKQDMTGDIQRVQGLLNDQILNYATKISDWSVWDDSYKFVQDKNQDFIDTNLQNSTFSSQKLNFIFYISSSSAIVYGKGVDIKTQKEIAIPQDLNDLLSKPNILTVHKTTDSVSSGIIKLSSGFLLFASRPILHSNGLSPIGGAIVVGRYLDKDLLTYLATLNRSNLSIKDYSAKITEKDFLDAKKALSSGNNYFVETVSASEVAGFTMVNDFNNQPAFILENELPRPFYIEGNGTVYFFIALFLLSSILGVTLGFLVLNKLIISRISNLNNQVNKIRDPNNQTQRLAVISNDEISNLANNFNRLLFY